MKMFMHLSPHKAWHWSLWRVGMVATVFDQGVREYLNPVFSRFYTPEPFPRWTLLPSGLGPKPPCAPLDVVNAGTLCAAAGTLDQGPSAAYSLRRREPLRFQLTSKERQSSLGRELLSKLGEVLAVISLLRSIVKNQATTPIENCCCIRFWGPAQ